MLSSAIGGALCANQHERLEMAQETYQVTRAEVSVPQHRTRWIISCTAKAAPADGLLRFGEPFQLIAASSNMEDPLYLQGQRYTLANAAYSRSVNGERKQCVCLAHASSYMTTFWTVNALNPNAVEQLKVAGQPVPANLFVSIQHVGTKILLCTDAHKERNKHGPECSVSLFTDTEKCKAEWGVRDSRGVGACNHFAFSTGA